MAVIFSRMLHMRNGGKAAALACSLLWPVVANAQAVDIDVAATQAQLDTMRATLSQLDDIIVTLDDRLVELLNRMDATEDPTARARMRESADAMTKRLDSTEALQSSLSVRIQELDATLARFSRTGSEMSGMSKRDTDQ